MFWNLPCCTYKIPLLRTPVLLKRIHFVFSNFVFLNPKKNSNLNSNCSNLLDMRKLQKQVKKVF